MLQKSSLAFICVEVDGKVGRGHLLGHDLLEAASAAGRVEDEVAVWTVVEGAEERHALDVVPVEMRNENVRGKGTRTEFVAQFAAQHAEAGAAIEDVNLISDANFDAGGVASVA